MINKLLKIFTILCLILIISHPIYVKASEVNNSKTSIIIKVEQILKTNSNHKNPKDTFTYTLKPISKNAPLPENNKEKYNFKITGNSTKDIIIDFNNSGEYAYKLSQNKTDLPNLKSQDSNTYTLKARVFNTITGLHLNYFYVEDENNHKLENIIYTNYYVDDVKQITQTGVHNNDKVFYIYCILCTIFILIYFYKKNKQTN